MANDFKIDLIARDGNLRQTLERDTKEMAELGRKTDQTSAELMKYARNVVDAGARTTNYKKQLAQITREIQDLTLNLAMMTREERASAQGKAMEKKLDDLKKKAGQFKDTVADVNAEIKQLASDTPVWDSISASIDTASSALTAYTAATELVGVDSDHLAQVVAKLATMQAVANAAIKIGNALQYQSSVMIGVNMVKTAASTLATKADTIARAHRIAAIKAERLAENGSTVATVAHTVATKAATVAQKAFNIVARANPYVLLATAIIGVCAALYAFTSKSDDAKKAEEERQKSIEESRKKYDNYRDTVAQNSGQMVSSYQELRTEYSKLKTNLEKTQFIKNNASEFNKLGITISNVADADNVFVNNTDKVVKALELRARAMALQNLNAQAYEQYYKKIINADATVAGGGYYRQAKKGTKIDNLSREEREAAGIKQKYRINPGTVSTTTFWYEDEKGRAVTEINQEQTDKINAYRQKKARETNQQIKKDAQKDLNEATNYATKELERLNREMQNLSIKKVNLKGDGNSPTGGGNGGGKTTTNTNNNESYTVGSFRYANRLAEELQKKLEGMKPDTPEFEKTKQLLADARKEVERIKKLMDETTPRTKAEELVNSYSNAVTEINTILKKVKLGEIDTNDAKKQIEVINNTLQKMGAKPIEVSIETEGSVPVLSDKTATATIDIVANTDALDDVSDKLDNLSDKKVKIDVETTNTTTNVTKGSAADISDQNATATIDIVANTDALDDVSDKLDNLSDKKVNIDVETTNTTTNVIDGSAPEFTDKSSTVMVDVVANTDALDDVSDKLDNLSDKKVKIDVETTNTTTNVTKGSAPESTDKSSTMTVDIVANTDLLIKAYEDANKEIQNIAKQQEIGLIDVDTANKQINVVNSMLKNIGLKPIVKEIKPEVDEGSLVDIQNKISDLNARINTTVDESKIAKFRNELNELERQERIVKFRVDAEGLQKIKDDINDIINESSKDLILNLQVKTQSEKAIDEADAIGNKYYNLQKYLKDNEKEYQTLKDKSKQFNLTAEEKSYLSTYERGIDTVNALGDAYVRAADKANRLQVNKLSWDGFRKGISTIGNVASSIHGLSDSWTNMKEQWNDMSAFEQTISVIENVCSTFETLIQMYEGVNEVIKIFQTISETATASKIAGNQAEMASESAKMTQETTDTALHIANNTEKMTSDAGEIATSSGAAIAGATASGASLPFPANLAAIAAGVAAVVSCLAMISSFQNGGIIKAQSGAILGGATTNGDRTLFYGNRGEMVLNTREQANLFRMLNSGSTGAKTSISGGVEFKIRGSELVGVLSNYNSKKRHI